MVQAFGRAASDVEQLSERLRELECRVSALEHPPEKSSVDQPALANTAPQTSQPPATRLGFPSVDARVGVLPVLGTAVLGIAGAYLLRAIAESSVVLKLPLLILAVVYAGLWLVWAVRTHATSRFASITYGITAALILSPLLWESTVRFHALSPAVTAMVLAGFVVLAFALGWHRKLQVIPWIATLASVVTAVALIIATHELVPLAAALLFVALATELASCLGYTLSLRAVSALAADFSVWLLVVVLMSSEGVPATYHPASPTTITVLCFALFAIYGGNIGFRSFGLRHQITIFEIAQGVLALALAAFGVVRASHGSAAPALGAFFLLLAAACYWGTLSRFAPDAHARNRRVCATWAAALLLAGSFLLFSVNIQVPFLCLAAVMAVFVYTRTGKLTIGMHASFYLAAAAVVSPILNYAENALAGIVPAAPDQNVWIVAASSVLCYAIGSRGAEDHGRRRLLWIIPAALAGFAAAALAIVAIVWLAAGRLELNASRLSVIRTVVTCSLAVVLGFLGSRLKRAELGWVAYAVVVFGALKLLFEDLRFGNAASLMVSLLFYGLILILLPRLMRLGRAES